MSCPCLCSRLMTCSYLRTPGAMSLAASHQRCTVMTALLAAVALGLIPPRLVQVGTKGQGCRWQLGTFRLPALMPQSQAQPQKYTRAAACA